MHCCRDTEIKNDQNPQKRKKISAHFFLIFVSDVTCLNYQTSQTITCISIKGQTNVFFSSNHTQEDNKQQMISIPKGQRCTHLSRAITWEWERDLSLISPFRNFWSQKWTANTIDHCIDSLRFCPIDTTITVKTGKTLYTAIN